MPATAHGRLTAGQIYSYARDAGFSPAQAQTMTAIALAESGGRLYAHATHGEDSRGLWQINVEAHPYLGDQDLYDPVTNARAAYRLSNHGRDVSIWSTTHNLSAAPYLHYREQAEAAARAHGDPTTGATWTGTTGYGHPIPAAGGGDAAKGSEVHTPAAAEGTGATASPPDTRTSGEDDSIAARVHDEITHRQNPYQIDSLHVGIADGSRLAASTSTSSDPLVAGFSAEYVDEHTGRGGAPAIPAVSASEPSGDSRALATFLSAANGEVGESYVWAAKPSATEAHPTQFDCSGFTRWAAGRAGTSLPVGAAGQYRYLKSLGLVIPVDKAERIPGALLFHFDGEPGPGGGEPEVAHVVISDGKRGTIEAMDTNDGVVRSTAAGRFDFAALVPGISAPPLSSGHYSTDEVAHLADMESAGSSVATSSTHSASAEGPAQVDGFLAAIRQHESSGDYHARAEKGGAAGAYQFIPSTWATWCHQAGYGDWADHDPADAPPSVQDAVAKAMALEAYSKTHDWGAVACIWYIGHQPVGSEWDTVPMPQYGNVITPRQYADDVLTRMRKIEPPPTHASAPPETPGATHDLADTVAKELIRGENPFLADTGHTGLSDGTRFLSEGSTHPSASTSPEDELLQGFKAGWEAEHPDTTDHGA